MQKHGDLPGGRGGYGGYNYRCKKCGYSGALVVEFDDDITPPEEERELQKEYREEVQEYEQKRRSLFWIIMALIFIGVILFVRF
ncbi:hypothetical protein [Methanogenium cariaci]|uniref:hypothetical protein n=1 Tax=Methanogenium cariaci TaxID=2197 RepID=UPI00155D8BEF|nr:hypothetical protein [Methanogenium cariaci]